MKTIRLILIIFAISIIAWLFILDFVPGEKLELSYDFCHPTPMLTELSPGNRLWSIDKSNGECWQRIASSPVYFDSRAPQYFDRAKVEIKYKKPADEEFQLGPQTKKGEWQWLLQDIEQQATDGDWQIGSAEFNLNGIYQNSPHLRWLISAPAIEENKQVIYLSHLKIIYYKQPLSLSNFTSQVKSYLRKMVRNYSN